MAELAPTWQQQLDPALVGRLTQPLQRPGMLRPDLAQRIQQRLQRGTVSSTAIATQLLQRRHTSGLLPSPALPLVYAQRPTDGGEFKADSLAPSPLPRSTGPVPLIIPKAIQPQLVQRAPGPISPGAKPPTMNRQSEDIPVRSPHAPANSQTQGSRLPIAKPFGRRTVQSPPQVSAPVNLTPLRLGISTPALQRRATATSMPQAIDPSLRPVVQAGSPHPISESPPRLSPASPVTIQRQELPLPLVPFRFSTPEPTPEPRSKASSQRPASARPDTRQELPLPLVPFRFSTPEPTPEPRPNAPAKAESPAPALPDTSEVIEQTLRQMARRLTIEQERRGGQPWF